MLHRVILIAVCACISQCAVNSATAADRPVDGNRLTYLDRVDPYYVGRDFPKLTTPMWVGEKGVEAVVVLAIDDMRETAKYEKYLRPILQRLKEIDGRAPVSIMTCNVKPDDPQLAQWLDEGLSIECHTIDHPCPLLADGDFKKAKSTYDRCVDLLYEIPGNHPVAFRTPCCDSLNTVSPRTYAEIFNHSTPGGHYLSIDSSVFNIFTSDDPDLSRELVLDGDGGERFRKYIPKNLKRNGVVFDGFVNTIENYPYPYVIGGLCWQFPCVVPSDWEAQHFHKPNNPRTVHDMQAALDCTVEKRGVYNLVFHPHGWIESEQVVELIDHAVEKHGRKVKFLTFREALDRLNRHLLAGQPLRNEKGRDNGVRILDVNNDGFLDVVTSNAALKQTRVWRQKDDSWQECETPFAFHKKLTFSSDGKDQLLPVRAPYDFGVLHKNGNATFIYCDIYQKDWPREGPSDLLTGWTFAKDCWVEEESFPKFPASIDRGDAAWIRFHDLDGDGLSDILAPSAFNKNEDEKRRTLALHNPGNGGKWKSYRWGQPPGGKFPFIAGLDESDNGLRLVDLDGDGRDDLIHSDPWRCSVHLFAGIETGWSRKVFSHERSDGDAKITLPPIIRENASNNGFFVHSGRFYWQNEHTAKMKDLVERRSFKSVLSP